jgi:hypothetical protein
LPPLGWLGSFAFSFSGIWKRVNLYSGLDCVYFAGKVPEVSLRVAKPAANLFSDALASAGFRIAADIDAEEPVARSATNDLANLAGHFAS